MRDARSSTYMSNGPSWVATFIQLTLSVSRMFVVTPMRAICSLITVTITWKTDFSVLFISYEVKYLSGLYATEVSSHFDVAGASGRMQFAAGRSWGRAGRGMGA